MPRIYSVIFVGPGGSGKTSILKRLSEKVKLPSHMTIGVDIDAFWLKKGESIVIVYDFGGQRQFREVVSSLLKDAHLVVLVFDAVRPGVIKELYSWFNLVKKRLPTTPILLVMNKVDLQPSVDPSLLAPIMADDAVIDMLETTIKDMDTIMELKEVILQHLSQIAYVRG